jgi:hypothetical protein
VARPLAFIVLPIVLGTAVVLVLANTPWGNERVRRIIVSQANARLNGHLAIGHLQGNLLSSATLTDVRLTDSVKQPVFTARRVRVRYGLWAALNRRVAIEALELDTAFALLDKRPGAPWNFRTLVRPGAPKNAAQRSAPPELADVTIRHGRFVYRRPWRPDSTLPADKRDAAIAAALASYARSRTERVPGGFQRVLEYHDIDARVPTVELAHDGRPHMIRVAALSMIGEPYRPPTIDVRSLTGTIYASSDSLWFQGMHLTLPASQLSGDGRIGFNRSGLVLNVSGAPVALADLRWLNPKLPAEAGGGRLRIAMRLHGDSAEYAVSDADLRYRDATARGSVALTRVHHRGSDPSVFVRSANVVVSRLSTAVIDELMPSLKLRRSGTVDGRLAVSGAPRALQVNADLRFDDVRAGRSHVIARGGVALDRDLGARDLDVQLRPLRLATLAGAGVRLPIGGIVTGSAVINGTSREGWSVRGDLTHEDAGHRSRVIGSGRYQHAGKRIVADATLQPLSLSAVGLLAPSAELRGSITGRVHAEGTMGDLRISGAVRSTTGGGSLDGRGAVWLAGPHTRYDVALALQALNARAFSRRAPDTRLTGTISARGRGTSPASADATIAADLVRSRYDTFRVDRLLARLAASGGLLRADTIVVVADAALARASGTLGLTSARDGTMRVAVSVDSLGALRRWLGTADSSRVSAAPARRSAQLAAARADSARRADATRIERLALGLPPGVTLRVDTLPAIRRDSLAGSLYVAATLHGNVKRLSVEARVRGRDVVIRGNAARTLAAELSSPDMLDRSQPLMLRLDADSLQANGYAFEKVEASGRRIDQRVAGEVRLRQDSHVSYAALGSYEWTAPDGQRLRLDSLSARFDTLVWRLAHPAIAGIEHGTIVVDSLDLRSSVGGRLYANGFVPKSGGVRLDVAVENVRVATVLQALQRDDTGDGVLTGAARIGGTRIEPTITGRATLRDATYRGSRAPDADLDLRYATRRLALEASARDSTNRRVLAATASLPLDLALENVSGLRRTAGPVVIDVVLDSLDLAALPLSSRSVDDVRGTLAGDAHVRGSWRAPEYAGRIALRGGEVTLVTTGMRIGDAVAMLRVAGDTLRLDSLVARDRRGEGILRGMGTISLADLSRPFVNVRLEGRDLRVMDQTRGVVDADGDITAVGPLDAVRVTGRGEMRRGFLALRQFNKNLLRVKAPGDLNFFTVYDTTAPAASLARADRTPPRHHRVGMIADLSLVVDRGSYYRNRPDANTEFYTGEGDEVRVHIDTRRAERWAAGFVHIGEGVAIFRARSFVPVRGSLTFTPFTNGPGYLQQVGERPVWEPGRGILPLQLLTGGTSRAPAVGLESGGLFPIRGRELNGYLTMGRDHTSLLQQSGSSLSGSASWSGQLAGETGALARRQQAATALGVVLHDIGTGATKEFGLDAFSVTPADVPTELVFGKTGGVRGATIEGGRYVTLDRYLAGQLRLTTGIAGVRFAQRFGNAYRLDVGIEPRFLFHAPSDLGITHPTLRTGTFGAFLTRMWDW